MKERFGPVPRRPPGPKPETKSCSAPRKRVCRALVAIWAKINDKGNTGDGGLELLGRGGLGGEGARTGQWAQAGAAAGATAAGGRGSGGRRTCRIFSSRSVASRRGT